MRDATGELTILHDISFELTAQESAAIVGASGSGKSTLLAILAGLDVPSGGTVKLRGQDLFTLNEDERAAVRARELGFVFQSFQLLPNLTALENVMLPLELRGEREAKEQAAATCGRGGWWGSLSGPSTLAEAKPQRAFGSAAKRVRTTCSTAAITW